MLAAYYADFKERKVRSSFLTLRGMDLGVSKPALQCCFYEFRSIVASDICRRSMSLYQPIKLIEHVCGSNTPSHMNQMNLRVGLRPKDSLCLVWQLSCRRKTSVSDLQAKAAYH